MTPAESVGEAVRAGLLAPHKTLPTWLLYDAEGSQLYESITHLPEYYLTRAEKRIFDTQADAIVAAARSGARGLLSIAELGAGAAVKTQVFLGAVVRAQGHASFLAADISRTSLFAAATRIAHEEPGVLVRPLLARHEDALVEIGKEAGRKVVLFLGSSIGNYDDDEARPLLAAIRRSLLPDGLLLLGTDLRKDPAVLVRAYADRAGVTAAFNKNVLARINRELGGRFDLDAFRHVAIWNESDSRIEMHLESLVAQSVRVEALDLTVTFARGERIHTESSVKYDDARARALFSATGFTRVATFTDDKRRVALHLGRARHRGAWDFSRPRPPIKARPWSTRRDTSARSSGRRAGRRRTTP
jgi:dimethylhistidine N-methyltransferase